jgi:hypothetical protein
MLGKYRLVKTLGLDKSGKILAEKRKWGRVLFKNPFPTQSG